MGIAELEETSAERGKREQEKQELQKKIEMLKEKAKTEEQLPDCAEKQEQLRKLEETFSGKKEEVERLQDELAQAKARVNKLKQKELDTAAEKEKAEAERASAMAELVATREQNRLRNDRRESFYKTKGKVEAEREILQQREAEKKRLHKEIDALQKKRNIEMESFSVSTNAAKTELDEQDERLNVEVATVLDIPTVEVASLDTRQLRSRLKNIRNYLEVDSAQMMSEKATLAEEIRQLNELDACSTFASPSSSVGKENRGGTAKIEIP